MVTLFEKHNYTTEQQLKESASRFFLLAIGNLHLRKVVRHIVIDPEIISLLPDQTVGGYLAVFFLQCAVSFHPPRIDLYAAVLVATEYTYYA